MQIREKLLRRAEKAGLALAQPEIDGLEAYFGLLQKWNERVSLTSLPTADAGDAAIDRLLIEPVLAARRLPTDCASIMDVGSGGGSPAIPIKIAAPAVSMRMVESKTRKAAFLREAVRTLELPNTVVEAVRLEELLSRPQLHDSADVVTIRAVRVEQRLLATVQAFLKPDGVVFLFSSEGAGAQSLPPQLSTAGAYALLPHQGSRLTVLRRVV